MLGTEYTLIDKINVLRGLVDTFATLYPQLQDIDFRRDVPRLRCRSTSWTASTSWRAAGPRARVVRRSSRPRTKRLFSFPNAGHAVAFEQYQALNRIMSTALADADAHATR